jgi:hypothetical protein
VEETGVPRENDRPVARQTLSHKAVSNTPRNEQGSVVEKVNSKNCHCDLQQMFFKTFIVVYQQTLQHGTSSTVHEF